MGPSLPFLGHSCCCKGAIPTPTQEAQASVEPLSVRVAVSLAVGHTPPHPVPLRVAGDSGQAGTGVCGLLSPSLTSRAQVPGAGRPRLGSAFITTPTGSWSAPTRAAWSAARASRTSGCTAMPLGATAPAPSSSSRRAAGWTTSTATTGAWSPGPALTAPHPLSALESVLPSRHHPCLSPTGVPHPVPWSPPSTPLALQPGASLSSPPGTPLL